MFLFNDKLTRHERGKFIIIEDTLDYCGRDLLKGIVKTFLKEGTSIKVLCYNSVHAHDWKNKPVLGGSLQICDHYSDPGGWISNVAPRVAETLTDAVEEVKSLPNVILVVDSLSTLILRSSAEKLYRTLCPILTSEGNNVQLLALLHNDVHCEETRSLLCSLATCTLTTLPPVNGNLAVSCISHHPRGKILNQAAQYQIKENFELKFVSVISEAKNVQHVVKQPDPAANLTFNLRLKDSEKEVRSKLQLPYMKTSPDLPEILNEDDFYDEDDPDDDLDV